MLGAGCFEQRVVCAGIRRGVACEDVPGALLPSIEILVMSSIVAILISILPALAMARELADRAVCMANVRGIIQSMLIYAQSNQGTFPLTPGDGQTAYENVPKEPLSPWQPGRPDLGIQAAQVWFTGAADNNDDPLACLWEMVLQNYISPNSFICPSDPIGAWPSIAFSGSGNDM